MRVLIADDEPPARQRLSALLAELGRPCQVVAAVGDGQQAIEACRRGRIDLALLDIRMPVTDGLDAARRIAELEHPPAIVFVTAYDDHALEAFETQAIDYLLKPVRRDRLLRAFEKASRLTRPQLDALAAVADPDADAAISASYRGGILRIPLNEVLYLRADSKYVVVRHAGGEALVEESLKQLDARFPGRFLRVHRNALVAPTAVSGTQRTGDGRTEVMFRDIDDRLEVSRRHVSEVRRWLKGG